MPSCASGWWSWDWQSRAEGAGVVRIEDLELATRFCALVDAPDLIEWLDLTEECTPEEAQQALAGRRRRMQAMQNNPKYREAARMLMKNYAALRRVVEMPGAHPQHVQAVRDVAQRPMLALAVDSVLVDGALTREEERFIASQARRLGLGEEVVQEVMAERAAALGVDLERARSQGQIGLRPPSGADGHAWWDASFTRALLELIPERPGSMVDIYCRTGLSARTLLPRRPGLGWLGVDRDPDRVRQARMRLSSMAAIRVEVGRPDRLPVEAGTVDVLLGVRSLATQARTGPVLHEARRVLRPGGRLVLAEPDGLAESFVFDGHIFDYNAAFRALGLRVDERSSHSQALPDGAGIALGPQLPARMEAQGFAVTSVRVHASYRLKTRSFHRFARQLRRYPVALAGSVGLPEDAPEVRAVLDEVDALAARVAPDAMALCGHVLPMYLVAADRES